MSDAVRRLARVSLLAEDFAEFGRERVCGGFSKTLLIATLADHLDIGNGHMTVFLGVFVHAVLLGFFLGLLFHAVDRGIGDHAGHRRWGKISRVA